MSIDSVIIPFFAVLNIILGLLVLLKNPKEISNKLYTLAILMLSIWVIIVFIEVKITDVRMVEIMTKLDFALAPFLPYLFLLFVLKFPIEVKISKVSHFLLFLLALVFSLLLKTSLIVERVDNLSLNIIRGPLHPFYTFYFLVYIISICLFWIWSYKKSKGLSKMQHQYILFGFSLTAIILVVQAQIFPYLNIQNKFLVKFGLSSISIFVLFSAYAILRYRFMGLRVIIKRSFIFIFFVILLSGILLFVVYFIGQISENIFSADSIIFLVLIAIIIALGMSHLKKLFDRVFVKEKYDFYKEAEEINRLNKYGANIEDLLHKVSGRIISEVGVSKIYFFVLNKRTKVLEFQYPERKARYDLDSASKIVSYFENKSRMLVLEEIPFLAKEFNCGDPGHLNDIEKWLKKINGEIVVPLKFESLVGLMVLDKKVLNKAYTKEDLEFIEEISRPLSMALFNALLWQETMEGLELVSS